MNLSDYAGVTEVTEEEMPSFMSIKPQLKLIELQLTTQNKNNKHLKNNNVIRTSLFLRLFIQCV